jgi:hypothetical protein
MKLPLEPFDYALDLSPNLYQIRHFVDHAAIGRRINDLNRIIDAAQAKATHAHPVFALGADQTSDQSYFDFFGIRHKVSPT